ncbi:NADPH:quinone reductase [Parafrankia soli]|uniref:NADPH:quinone reductase n=1 Tax=Parafrankia soli TaxID=2599596 RepID=A0A1S1PVA5_9ACTN|nr:NAD(P)-dependent alcohol dehydrogenase [Parafrankia soli]OHV24895.1 NADPH:quinone reductase [Parafrankia soli]
MKAVVQDRFGPPDILRLADVDVPVPGPDEVLVRVRAAALNPYDWHMLRGDPYVARLMGGMGLRRPKNPVAGLDAAGVVEAVGVNVRELSPGTEVFGFCPGAFAELARTRPGMLARKPAGLAFSDAAALPTAGTTALRGVRETGEVRAGTRLLVNGAAGGVGTYAVQIAAGLGAEVTGVCSGRNAELVRSLGAAHVVDYTKGDFTADGFLERHGGYDVILDNVGNHPLRRLRRALAPRGTLVVNAGGSPGRVFGAVGAMLGAVAADRFVRQHLRVLPTRLDRSELAALADLAAAGGLTTVVDRTIPLVDVAAGLALVEAGHVRGKIVVDVV